MTPSAVSSWHSAARTPCRRAPLQAHAVSRGPHRSTFCCHALGLLLPHVWRRGTKQSCRALSRQVTSSVGYEHAAQAFIRDLAPLASLVAVATRWAGGQSCMLLAGFRCTVVWLGSLSLLLQSHPILSAASAAAALLHHMCRSFSVFTSRCG